MELKYLKHVKGVSDFLHYKHEIQDSKLLKYFYEFPINTCQLSSRLLLKVLQNTSDNCGVNFAEKFGIEEIAGYHSTSVYEGDGWHCWLNVNVDDLYIDISAYQFEYANAKDGYLITRAKPASMLNRIPSITYNPKLVVLPKQDKLVYMLYNPCKHQTISAQNSSDHPLVKEYLNEYLDQ